MQLLVKKIGAIAPAPVKQAETPSKKTTTRKPKYKAEKVTIGTPASAEVNPWVKTVKAWAAEKGLKTELCENGYRVDVTSLTEDFRLCIIRMPSARFSIGLYFDSDSPDYTKSFESCQIPFVNMLRFVEWLFEGREQFKFEE